MRTLVERYVAAVWPPRCPRCRTPMTLEREAQVSSMPPVFEAVWACAACGEETRRCRVIEAIH